MYTSDQFSSVASLIASHLGVNPVKYINLGKVHHAGMVPRQARDKLRSQKIKIGWGDGVVNRSRL